MRTLAALLAAMAFLSAAAQATADPGDDRYDNTFMKDFIMDAPWRVTDATTAIPLTIILKDCDADDLTIGDNTSGPSAASLPMTVRWASSADFGPATSVQLIVGDASGTSSILSLNASATGEQWSGERTVDLGTHGFAGGHYFRAECMTDDGDDVFRVYSNPIWVTFDGASVAEGHAEASLSISLARLNAQAGTAVAKCVLVR